VSLQGELSLRKNVTYKHDKVWSARGDRDIYLTKQPRTIQDPQVDHVLEVQVVESAAKEMLKRNGHLSDHFKEVVNSTSNLNVTSQRVNQAKKGPFTYAVHQLSARDGTLREISVEQYARQHSQRWMVDDGTWANIEREVIVSYEDMAEKLTKGLTKRVTRAEQRLINKTVDDLHEFLQKIKIL
jgi:hypothetical protein